MSSSNNKISRSVRLRKYEAVYQSCMNKNTTTYKKSLNKITSGDNLNVKNDKNKQDNALDIKKQLNKKRSLNDYQKFVKNESQRSKYKGMVPTERFSSISKKWNLIKNNK